MASVDTCWVSSKNTHDVTSHVSTIEPFHITPQDMTLLFTSVQYVTRETHESAEGCFPVFQTGSGGVEKSKSRGKDFTARAFPLERNACFCVHSTQNACGPPHLFRNVLARFLSFSSDVPAFSRVCVVPSVKCTLLAFDYVLAKVSAFIFPEAHSTHCRCSEKNVSRRTFDFTPLIQRAASTFRGVYYRRTILLSVKPYSHFRTLQNGLTLFHHKFVAYHVRTIRPR